MTMLVALVASTDGSNVDDSRRQPMCVIESAAEVKNFTSDLVGRKPNEVYVHKLAHADRLANGARQQAWSTFCFEWHANLTTFPLEVPCWACRSQTDLDGRTVLFNGVGMLVVLFIVVVVPCEAAQRLNVWRGARSKMQLKHNA